MAGGKTNAMRILDSKKAEYTMLSYEARDGRIDGISVAEKIGRPKEAVFKTLVTQGSSKENFVFVIPVEGELDLKKAAKAAGDKKVEMIPVKDIQKLTGYIRGGCSPIGMKKQFRTFIDTSVLQQEKVIVSGGKIGIQVEIVPRQLIDTVNAELAELVKGN